MLQNKANSEAQIRWRKSWGASRQRSSVRKCNGLPPSGRILKTRLFHAAFGLMVAALLFMTPADAFSFLQHKYALIVENTWSEENEKTLREFWEPLIAERDESKKLADLQKLDRAMEKALKQFVLREDRMALRESLMEQFGLSKLTAAEIEAVAIPPLGAGDLVFRPSGKEPVVKQRYQIDGVEHTLIDTSAATMTEFAQLYADFSRKEVHLPAALVKREIPRCGGAAAPGYLLQALQSHLESFHVAARSKGGRVVVFQDTEAEDAALAEARRPRNVTEEEIQRAAAAMSVDRFWRTMESATRRESECMAMAEALRTALKRLNADEILGFELRLQEYLAASYRWDLWAVAYIVNGGCSDDGFEYFRGWLFTQGRAYFEAALTDPERAADRAEGGATECEAILSVAHEAFASRAKKPMPYGLTPRPSQPIGADWKEEDLPNLYPRLTEKFG